MNLISVDNITRKTGDKTLFENISFGLDEGEKIGIIGMNGSGKSTFLKVISGLEEADSGKVMHNKILSRGFLLQSPEYKKDKTADQIIEELSEKSGTDPEIFQRKMKSYLQELNFTETEKTISQLSGGTVKKIALAELFAAEPNLYILDEPTNHLDIEAILWLEKKLNKTSAAVLLVTHDRYFLESIADKIYEIADGTIIRYDGNYSKYLELKEERRLQLEREDVKARSFLRTELEWLKRQPKARGTKQKARIDRIDDVMSRKKLETAAVLDFSVSGRKLGKKILELKNISKSFNNTKYIDSFNYIFRGNERIGIIGPNGTGKSTLLNLISGRLNSDTGDIVRGVNTSIGYFDQSASRMESDIRPIDYIKREAGERIVMPDGRNLTAAQLLTMFQFSGRMQNTPCGKLSGGEKRRLYLVEIIMKNPNFLLLDEPSNDLDITTLSVLEDFIASFPGCVLTVSHDRYFMDRVVDYLFVFEKNGKIREFPGNFSDYLLLKESEKEDTALAVKKERKEQKEKDKTKLTFKEKIEFNELEKEIEKLEKEKTEIETLLASGTESPEKITTAGIRFQELNLILEKKVKRWEDLAVFEI